MDLKLVENILEIAKENNITRAAEKLFITQSALNQQLLKLEKELGTPLFYRSRADWRLTAAGELYVEGARDLIRIKKETYNKIHDVVETNKGILSIGFTPERGVSMFVAIYPIFHKKFPNILIKSIELSVKGQLEMITSGELDIGILTISANSKQNLQCVKISSEELLLTIPQEHPLAKQAKIPFTELDIAQLKSAPFVLMYKKSTLRPIIDEIFEIAGYQPKVLFETSSNNVITTMIKSGVACGILPYSYVKDHLDQLACFYLPTRPIWNIVACYRKDAYLSKAAQYFIKLATEYWVAESS